MSGAGGARPSIEAEVFQTWSRRAPTSHRRQVVLRATTRLNRRTKPTLLSWNSLCMHDGGASEAVSQKPVRCGVVVKIKRTSMDARTHVIVVGGRTV